MTLPASVASPTPRIGLLTADLSTGLPSTPVSEKRLLSPRAEVEAGLIRAGLGAKAGLVSKAIRPSIASAAAATSLTSSQVVGASTGTITSPGANQGAERTGQSPVLSFGIPELDAVLPEGGLVKGSVVELAVAEGAPATSLALALCRSVQQARAQQGQACSWVAFVDPSESLHAPGVLAHGVKADQLLVLRPPLEALGRSVLRLARSSVFELVVVDLVGVPGASLNINLEPWSRWVRRLALELEGSGRSVLLITDVSVQRSLPLPVAQRLEVKRPRVDRIWVRIAKDRNGQITAPRAVPWSSTPIYQGSSGEVEQRDAIKASPAKVNPASQSPEQQRASG